MPQNSARSPRRSRRIITAVALAMPLVTLAATPALAEAAPSPSIAAEPATTPAATSSAAPDPFAAPSSAAPSSAAPSSAAPQPVTEATPSATPSATESAPVDPTPTPTPTPSATATTAPAPSETPTAPPETPAALDLSAPPPEVAPMNSALAEAIQRATIDDPAFRLRFIELVKQRIATEPDFAASFRAEVQRRIATDPFFALTWRAGMRAELNANFGVGATTWTGGPIRHPRGFNYYWQVMQWGELALGVMAELNIDPYYFPGIMAQIQQESAGNPGAVNGWDSNWAIGYASYGLLQTIAPTYRAYAKPGYTGTLTYKTVNGRGQQFQEPWQTYPYTNLYAALNYVISRYGYSKFKSWNAGYNQGY